MRDSADTGARRLLAKATLIAGPTASGKSALALDLAKKNGAVIVNTDSMQVYSVLSVLTARPTAEDLIAAPHYLYGHVPPSRAYSTGDWIRDVIALSEAENLYERPVIFVGGTGLYFRALMKGLSPMPEIPETIRSHWRSRLKKEGAETLHRLLVEKDPVSAARFHPSDAQRILRALEVLDASGKPIGHWQAEPGQPLIDAQSATKIVLEPDRIALAERIKVRFEQMLEMDAVKEVEQLLRLGLPPLMPAMKAIGVRELAAALDGTISLAEATARAKAATRQYSKRQMTWFRHQLGPDWQRIKT